METQCGLAMKQISEYDGKMGGGVVLLAHYFARMQVKADRLLKFSSHFVDTKLWLFRGHILVV